MNRSLIIPNIKGIIIFSLLLILVIFSYRLLSRQISENNHYILELNRELEIIDKVIADYDFLESIEYILSDEDYQIIYRDIKKSYFKSLNGNSAEFDIQRIKNRQKSIISIKRETITDIRKLMGYRSYVLIFGVLLLFMQLFISVFKFNQYYRIFSKYIKNIELKKYDMQIDSKKYPQFNSLTQKIVNLGNNLQSIDDAIEVSMKGYGTRETLQQIFNNEKFNKYISFDRIGFAKLDGGNIVANVGFSNNNKILLNEGYTLPIEKTSLRELMDSGRIRIIPDLIEYMENNPNSASTELLIEEGYRSSITAPVFDTDGIVFGFLFFSSKKVNNFSDNDIFKIKTITQILSSVFTKNLLIDDLITNTAISFVRLVEEKDPETSDHLDRMQAYTRIISEKLVEKHLYTDVLDYHLSCDLIRFAPLHDIGKVGIPDSILLKPGKLTEAEFNVIKNHTVIGSQVLSEFENKLKRYDHDFFKVAVNIVLYHHERWNGEGYPFGLKENEIPIEARIIAVADVLDALTSKRIYKDAIPLKESLDIISIESGKSFDPVIVQTLMDSREEIEKIYNSYKPTVE